MNKKIRLSSWYWGNYVMSNGYEATKNGWKIGSTIHGYEFEEYQESKHGWHHSEEFENAKCFNSRLLKLAVELNTINPDIVKTEFNKRYNDNLNSFDIEVGLSKKYIQIESNEIRYSVKKQNHSSYSILEKITGCKDD